MKSVVNIHVLRPRYNHADLKEYANFTKIRMLLCDTVFQQKFAKNKFQFKRTTLNKINGKYNLLLTREALYSRN